MLEHAYGSRVEVFDDPYLNTLLARIGAPETGTGALPALVRSAYRRLTGEVLAAEFPLVEDRVPTRMKATEPRAVWSGTRFCPRTPLVVCGVIRAGILPAQIAYETACEVLPPENVRLDFVTMSRTTDAHGAVTGVRTDGTKLGGSVKGAIVLIPDPMGATGSTVEQTLDIYMSLPDPPRAVVAMHMIATPESVHRLLRYATPAMDAAEIKLYTGRLDRGLSDDDVLATPPGTHPDRERGLNRMDYVVPGAGGLGELLTNSWI